MLNFRLSEFWSIIPSLMQAWIRYYIPSLLFCLRSLLPPIVFQCPPELFYSPVRLTPVVGVTTGAHYRTSIQELLHLRTITMLLLRSINGFWRICPLGRCNRCVNNNTSVKNIFLGIYIPINTICLSWARQEVDCRASCWNKLLMLLIKIILVVFSVNSYIVPSFFVVLRTLSGL